MDKIQKVLIAAIIVTAVMVAVATIEMMQTLTSEVEMMQTLTSEVEIRQTPTSQIVTVALGDDIALPLAEDCKVYAEYLHVSHSDYKYRRDQGLISNLDRLVEGGGERVNLYISTYNTSTGFIDWRIAVNIPIGGVGVFMDNSGKEYLIFFENTCEVYTEDEDGVKDVKQGVLLRVRQL